MEETDESVEAAVIREVKEEAGLDFVPRKKFYFYESKSANKRAFALVFLGSWSGEVALQESEIQDYGWFTYEQAMKEDIAYVYREVLEDLKQADLIN
ncbi:MAG: NUDIX hydrolase [Patescibacteria group bacterium]